MTITVDSGYFKIPQSKLDATKAMGILSDGTIADNYMSADDKFVEVSTDSQMGRQKRSWMTLSAVFSLLLRHQPVRSYLFQRLR